MPTRSSRARAARRSPRQEPNPRRLHRSHALHRRLRQPVARRRARSPRRPRSPRCRHGRSRPDQRSHPRAVVLRARRRIAEAKPGWALSPTGLAGLRGRGGRAREDEASERNEKDVEPLASTEKTLRLMKTSALGRKTDVADWCFTAEGLGCRELN